MSEERIQAKSLERLIAEGITVQNSIRELQRQLQTIVWQVEERLSARRTNEEVTTESGRVVRTVRNAYLYKPGRLDYVREILGNAYAHMLDKEYPMGVTRSARDLINNPDSAIGRQLRFHVTVHQTVHIAFNPPLGETTVDEYGITEKRIIDLAEVNHENFR